MTSKATTKGVQRRGEIIAVARQLLVEEGYDRFVLREIASRVGIKLGNLQYYFRTRELLLEAVVRAQMEGELQIVEAASVNTHPSKQGFSELVRTLLKSKSEDEFKVYTVAAFLEQTQPLFGVLLDELYEQIMEGLIPVLKKLNPKARRSTLLHKARLIMVLLDGADLQLQSGEISASSRTRKRFIDDICGLAVSIVSE